MWLRVCCLCLWTVPLSTALGKEVEADAGGPYTVDAESSVTLDASATEFDDDCVQKTYTWTLDNIEGAWKSGKTVEFQAAEYDGPTEQKGTLEVEAVCDEKDKSDDDDFTIDIANVAPKIVAIDGPDSLEPEEEGVFSVSWTDVEAADVDDTTAEWDLGDTTTRDGSLVAHTWRDAGTYTIEVTVTDDDGGTDSEMVTVFIGVSVDTGPTLDTSDPVDPELIASPTGCSCALVGAGPSRFSWGLALCAVLVAVRRWRTPGQATKPFAGWTSVTE